MAGGRPDVDRNGSESRESAWGESCPRWPSAVDPAIREGAFLLAGGDLSPILWEMPEGAADIASTGCGGPHQARPEAQ